MEQLTSMGFEEAAAREALAACGGSVEAALNALLGQGAEEAGGGAGGEAIVRLGCSQYSFEVGASACTPIACTLVSSVLRSLRDKDRSFLDSAALTDLVFTGVGSYLATMGDSSEHLAAEELYHVSDVLQQQLRIVGSPHQGMVTTPRVFESLVADVRASTQLVAPGQHIGVVLTKPPETVGFIVPPAGSDGHFIFFDSHARPQYGFDGAYLVAGETQDTITTRLYGLFESDLGQELGADMMTATYNMFEATLFQLSPSLGAAEPSPTAAPAPTPAPALAGQDVAAAKAPSAGTSEDASTVETPAPAEAKASAHGAGAPAKKSDSARRNPGIGMGVRIRNPNRGQRAPPSLVDPAERALIDQWIRANNLNQYGDPRQAMYAGGTPLFDERTATTRERYEYIVSQHPARPWAN